MDRRFLSQVFAMTRLSLWFCVFFSPAVSFQDSDESRHRFFLKPLERSIDDKSQINRLVSFEKSQSLAGGRYVTTTDTRQILALGNDLVAIDSTENFEDIERIYRVGNSGILNETDTNGTFSLAGLSVDKSMEMIDDPDFIIFRNTFTDKGLQNGEKQGYFRFRRADFYADTIVSDTISRKIIGIQSEAILALHVWMATTHELNSVWINCAYEFHIDESLTALDRAAAFWMGVEDGASSGGYLMHQLAESASMFFNISTDEALVNTQIIDGLASLQGAILTGDLCFDGKNHTDFKGQIARIKSLTIVPLLQKLIHYVMAGEEPVLTQIYLAAVIPHIAACDENLVELLDINKINSLNETDKLSWVGHLQRAFSCMKVSCEDIGIYTQDSSYPQCDDDLVPQFAGYVATNPESELYSRMDRDLQRLRIFLNEEALGLALDLYRQGYHASFSLQNMALNEVIPQGSDSFIVFDNHTLGNSSHDSTYQPDQELLMALQRKGMFRSLTSKQLSQVVLGLLSYHVSFFAIISALTLSKEKCGQEMTAALDNWDIAAGLYIGSTNTATDRGSNGGPLLYGVSRTLCPMFGTCSNGNSLVNKVILDALSAGKSSISNGDCVALENVIEESVIPALQTIVIQGILASEATFATSDDTRSTTIPSPGLVHAFARTLIPLLHQADPENDAWTKLQLLLPEAMTLSQESIYDLAQVLYAALPDLDTDCKSIGTLLTLNLTLCQDIRVQLPINKLTFGRYLFSDTDQASQIASIALDVRDMKNATSIQQALQIYRQGRHAYSSRHEQVTLSSFSVEATRWMGDNPIFNLYKYALYNESAVELHNATYPYADELILNTKNKQLLMEASVALNVWMMISHYLWTVWRTCNAHEDASRDVDAAVALWIGEGQQEGSFGKGWLVYSVAQEATQRFGHSEQEAVVNTKLMESFNTLQRISKSCSEMPQILPDIWGKILEVQRLLTIPLVQMLLSAIADNDQSRAAIYAMSVIPQSIGCNQKLYANLSEWLLTTSDYQGLNETSVDDLALFLECLDISCDDLNVTTSAPQKLQKVVGHLCAAQERSRTNSPSTDPIFRAASRINLDVLQIEIQLRTRSYQAAHDFYLYGRNVNISGLEWPGQLAQSSLFSLRNLATLTGNSTILEDLSEYYGSPRYADILVMESLQQEGAYSNVSSSLLALDNAALLQSLVFFQGIVWYLDAAVRSCEVDQLDVAKKAMLQAMGIFHGFPSGFSFRSLGDTLCTDFGTCAVRGGSRSNQVVLTLLQDGFSSLLSRQQCQEVQDTIENGVIPLLKIPLIQATLERAVFRGTMADSADEAHSSGFALSQAILPILANTNSESAELIQNIFGSPQASIASWEETESVFEAVQFALPGMNINCTYMGRWVREPLLSFCYDITVADGEKNPYSKFGIDIDEMQRALHDGASELARTIYVSGKNVVLNGTAVSLQSLYADATPSMATEPIFQLYRISHGGNPLYADSIIQGAFHQAAGSTKQGVARTLASTSPIATEAVLILILWMSVLHEINHGLQLFELSNGSPQELSKAIKRSRAYWIGDAQLGATESGHLLYGWANEMSSHFTGVDGIMPGVNDYILTMFADMQTVIWSASTSNSTKVAKSYDIFKAMIQQMSIPVVQGLVHALMINDKERVKLYAQAVFPLVTTCDRTEEQQMLESSKFINATFVTTEIDGMIDHIYNILLPCLGLKCREVGVPKSDAATAGFDERSSCNDDDPADKSYRGYQPRSFEVFAEVMRMGQDLREIELLLEAKAFPAAEQVYKYGHNGKSSLRDLARGITVSLNDTIVWEAFSSYYYNDIYGDTLVSDAIRDGLYRQDSNTTMKLSDEERRILAVGFSQMVVVPHAALGSMRDALFACRDPGAKNDDNNNDQEAMDAWDRAAALLLGSGRLSPFDMGEVYCRSFGTCDAKTGVAESNEMILELLYAGRGALAQGNATTLPSHTNHSHCDVLSKLSLKIQAQVWVPMIQATLQSAFDAAREKTPHAMAHAFVSSRAILPLLQESNPSIASRLTELVPLHQQSNVAANTGAVVMDLLSQVYEDLNIDCEWIGRLGEYNPCESNNANQYASAHQQGLSTGGLVAILLSIVLGMIVGYYCWKRKRVKRQHSTNGNMMAESNPAVLTMSDHCDGDVLPMSPTSVSSTSGDDRLPVVYSSVGKSRGRPLSDSTMETLDLQTIQKSFQRCHPRLSSKADRTLNRISSYGDDDESAVVDEDWLLQHKEKSVKKHVDP